MNTTSMRFRRLAAPAMLPVSSLIAVTAATAEGQTPATAPVRLFELAGPWSVSLIGNTGCGWTTFVVTFTLDTKGSGTATILSHTSGCGDGTTGDVPFVIQTLNANGSGTANLSCGEACGWEFVIQVARNREIFSLVDVDPANPGQLFVGRSDPAVKRGGRAVLLKRGTSRLPENKSPLT